MHDDDDIDHSPAPPAATAPPARTAAGRFTPGTSGNPRGRPKSSDLSPFKDALMVAFRRLGGVEGLIEWGREHPTEFYRLCGRLIPQEFSTKQTGEVVVRHVLPPPRMPGVDLNDTDRFIPFDQARRLGYVDDESEIEDAQPVERDADFDTPR
jgi:hypothetical protein